LDFCVSSTVAAVPPPIAGSVQAAQVDINSAQVPDLEALPGIGPVQAKKIVEGWRKRKDELVQKKIISQATYDKVKDQIVAKQR
jgi:DNA uptake protein ComE-like DNA-binding protein